MALPLMNLASCEEIKSGSATKYHLIANPVSHAGYVLASYFIKKFVNLCVLKLLMYFEPYVLQLQLVKQ